MRFLARLAKFWLLLAFLAIGLYLAIYNQERIHVYLPPWVEQIQVPAYIAYLASFVLGSGVMSVFFIIDHTRKSLEIRRLKKRLKELGVDQAPSFDRTAPGLSPEPSGFDRRPMSREPMP